ncbi:hypothetical protein [Streptomyces sp. NBC_01508]|uniref:hypothetical protein n=1 Tax=Streptomyces sp. NBC_01508 TaxID=2903888 RepID=UPI0038668CB7
MLTDQAVVVVLCLADLGKRADVDLLAVGVSPAPVAETEPGTLGNPAPGFGEDALAGKAECAGGLEPPAAVERLACRGQMSSEIRGPQVGQGFQKPVARMAGQAADGVQQGQWSGVDSMPAVDVFVEFEVGDSIRQGEPIDVGAPAFMVQRGDGVWEAP